MDIDDIQKDWGKQYKQENNLVVKLFRESRQDKVKSRLNNLTFFTILFMLYNVIVMGYAWMVFVTKLSILGFAVPSVLTILLSIVCIYYSILQLQSISKINFTQPIIEIQKEIEKLKLIRVKQNRFIFIFCLIYFWLLVFLVLGWNAETVITEIWQNAPPVIIVHVSIWLLWFPVSVWILKKYDSPNPKSRFWSKLEKNSLLTNQSVNFSLKRIQSFLNEIDDFEKEKMGN